ncbi:MAG: MFS transporter [Oscillospiraceae bacterium]|nr:MFS transporter [Oscillospiraceae bacterium]
MNREKSFYGKWIVIGSLMITVFTMAIINNTTTFYMTPVCQELGFSIGAFSAAYSMAAVGATIGAILAGSMLAKLPLKAMMCIGAIGTGLSIVGLSYADKLWHFYVLLLTADLFMAFVTNVPITTMINNWYVDNRGMMTGLVFAGAGFGSIFLSPLTEWMIKSLGWHASATISGLIIIVTALPACIFLFKKSPADKGQQPYTFPEGSAAAIKAAKKAEAEKAQNAGVDMSEGFTKQEATHSRAFLWLALGLLCMGMVSSGVMVHIPNFLDELAMNAGFVISVLSIGRLIGTFSTGVIMDKLGLVKALFISTCLFIGGMVCLVFTSAQAAVLPYIMALLVGLSVCVASVAPPMLTSEIFGMKAYSSLYGLNYAIFLIGCVLGPVICGIIYEISGYNLVWLIYIVFAVGMFVFSAMGIKAGKKYRKELALKAAEKEAQQ